MTKYLGVYKDIIVHSLFFQEYYYVWDVIERVNLYMMQNSSSPNYLKDANKRSRI